MASGAEPVELIVKLAMQRRLHRSIAQVSLEEDCLATECSYNHSIVSPDVQPGYDVTGYGDRAKLQLRATPTAQTDKPY